MLSLTSQNYKDTMMTAHYGNIPLLSAVSKFIPPLKAGPFKSICVVGLLFQFSAFISPHPQFPSSFINEVKKFLTTNYHRIGMFSKLFSHTNSISTVTICLSWDGLRVQVNVLREDDLTLNYIKQQISRPIADRHVY